MVFKAHHDTIDYQIIYDDRLPEEFDGFQIFFISDIHRRNIKKNTLHLIKDKIDIVVIGGDLTERGVPLERTKNNLRKIAKWKVPIYFVWGNNDYEAHPDKVYNLLAKENVRVLTNTNEDLTRNNAVLSLLGLDCCKYREARIDMARLHAKGDYHILLTHAPSAFYELEPEVQNQIHTVLAGHTHGGQIRFFGLGLYEKGGFNIDRNTNVLVSEGYGYTWLPFRFGTKSECHVVTFKNKQESSI